MIQKIGTCVDRVQYLKNYLNNNTDKHRNSFENNLSSTVPIGMHLNYFIPFLGKSSSTNKTDSSKVTKLENIMYYADTPTKKLISNLRSEAFNSGFDKVTTLHVIEYSLNELNDFVNALDSGSVEFNSLEKHPYLVDLISNEASPDIFSDKNLRKNLKKAVASFSKDINKVLAEHKSEKSVKKDDVTLSDDLVDAIWGIRAENSKINPDTFLSGAINSPDDITSTLVDNFFFNINDFAMLNKIPLDERLQFSDYETKAKDVLKKIKLGNNVYITYDSSKEPPQPFVNTLRKVIENDNQDNFQVTEFNEHVTGEYFLRVLNKLSKDKSKKHIVVVNPVQMMLLDSAKSSTSNEVVISADLLPIFLVPPANIRLLLYSSKDNYYSMNSTSQIFSGFEEISIPTLSTAQMLKFFKENKILTSDIKKPFSKKAIEKVVTTSAQMDGIFPLKTISLMKKIESYYTNKKEINETDVANYLKEATNLTKNNDNESSVFMTFDTEKTLKDFVGKSATKKEAASIVRQIKSNTMGTKGVIIYSQDGFPGGGRKFTAKAIAGEAKVPYIEINTMDFGTKEVDIFGNGVLSPEASIKKLFSQVKTQAEANPNKSAVLYIENFEYFSVGEMISIYHQKAMAQLLREMEKADKEGLNILVVGSVSNPDLIGASTMKSFKFTDSIEVSSPAANSIERAQIIRQNLKDLKLKLSGNKEAQDSAIQTAASMTEGLPFIYLKKFVKKAGSVALERGHKSISKGDFIEAYLQLTTGRPALSQIEEHEKSVTASHECGHATNLEVMNNIAKTLGKPWHIPDRVNFITLDPRGNYGGAMFHESDKNRKFSFENLFALLVCTFGGSSAEKLFFGMDGSFGISGDIEQVRNYTDIMVKLLGMGPNTGKMVINQDDDLSDNLKSLVEKDIRVIINNAKIASDLITEIYADFNTAFVKKYAPLVGTGNCILSGDDFRTALNAWKQNQSPEKQRELKVCDETIVKIMEATKKGIAVRKEN